MEDGHAIYLIHCIENPSQIHYDIVVQSMFYCAMLYDAQTEDITDSDTDSLHLSHYIYAENALPADTEKILPVVAMTLYFGTEPWTAPTDLHSSSISMRILWRNAPEKRSVKCTFTIPAKIAEYLRFHFLTQKQR